MRSGAVLTAVARRLTTGRVSGVDIWSTHDQSGNAREVTLRNASLEGVGERVDIQTGDMRTLAFPDATFDLVVSSLAIHTHSLESRSQAGGRRGVSRPETRRSSRHRGHPCHARPTQDALRDAPRGEVERRRLGWKFWWGNPIASTTLLTASKAPV